MRLLIFILLILAAQPAHSGINTATMTVNGEPVSACRVGMRPFESEKGLVLLGEVIAPDFPRLLPGWGKEVHEYDPDPVMVEFLSGVDDEVEITCVLGTWCHDSEREVPRFWKVLERAANPNLKLFMFAVGRSSDEEARQVMEEIGFDESLRHEYNVVLVPTFIFSRNGVELGRIVESPKSNLEQEAVEILGLARSGETQPVWK